MPNIARWLLARTGSVRQLFSDKYERLGEWVRMMEDFKSVYNEESVSRLAAEVRRVYPEFNIKQFTSEVMRDLETLELKSRVRLISFQLRNLLPQDFSKSIRILLACLSPEQDSRVGEKNCEGATRIDGFLAWPLLTYVEYYGLDHFELSVHAMYQMTRNFSAEFAIRPYLEKYEDQMFAILLKWTKDDNEHVRRLCSEGTRPHLPWGKKIECISGNLLRNIGILECLKYDKSEYVRRSVANHLNDISRLDKVLFLEILEKWSQDEPSVSPKLLRHASRTLLKQGDSNVLALHNYNHDVRCKIELLHLDKEKLKEGESLNLSFRLISNEAQIQRFLIEYVIYFLRKNGEYSRKVFRLKDLQITPKSQVNISKCISLGRVTTRRHYSGVHYITLQVNGVEYERLSFELTVQ